MIEPPNDFVATLKAKIIDSLPKPVFQVPLAESEYLHRYRDLDIAPMTDEFEWWCGGRDSQALIGFSQASIAVSVYYIFWAIHTPMACEDRHETLTIADLPQDLAQASAIVKKQLRAAGKIRRAQFDNCNACGKRQAPEHCQGDVCHQCMESRGFVF